MITIPKNRIIQSKGLGDTIGDIVESFNLDLSSNYGAVKVSSVKKGTMTGGIVGTPVGIVLFNNKYYFISEDSIYEGDDNPSETFTLAEEDTEINEAYSDIKVFNNNIYVTKSTKVLGSADGSTWSEAVSTGLTTATSHIMEVLKDKLYITDNNTKVFSMDTTETLSTSDAYTLALNLEPSWVITSLKTVGIDLFIGLLNQNTGEGKVVIWDGATANSYTTAINLPAGVVSACVLDNTHYIIDTEGILRRYAGNSYVEVDKLFKKKPFFFKGSYGKNNRRFVHPNGMQATSNGNILILVNNNLENVDDYEDTIPSGVYEWDRNIGIYHKYPIKTTNDFGQLRIFDTGALCVQKPTAPSLDENGSILFGAKYYTNSSSTTSGIFYDDTDDTTDKWGYFITSFQLSDTEETWQKLYLTYKRLKNAVSKFVVKYRSVEDTPTEATITWTDIDRFTTTTDISDYVIGDEVQVIQGNGSGMSAHITSITVDTGTYTVILDENFGSSTVFPGTTAKVLLSKWIKAGEVGYDDKKQLREFLLHTANFSPFIQFKVCMKFNGNEELYKLKIISNQDKK